MLRQVTLTYAATVSALESAGRSALEAATRAPETAVPSCPGWSVAQLVVHLHHIWDWAERNVAAPPGERVRLGRAPAAGPDDCAAALAVLVTTLREAAPENECAGPLVPRTAAWWARRQLLETVVHRWDVENAVGAPSTIDPAVAALGVAEFIEVFANGVAPPVRIDAPDAEVLLLLWGRRDLPMPEPDAETYRAWRAGIAT